MKGFQTKAIKNQYKDENGKFSFKMWIEDLALRLGVCAVIIIVYTFLEAIFRTFYGQ